MPRQSTFPSDTFRGGANAFNDGTFPGAGETAAGTYGVLRWTQTA